MRERRIVKWEMVTKFNRKWNKATAVGLGEFGLSLSGCLCNSERYLKSKTVCPKFL